PDRAGPEADQPGSAAGGSAAAGAAGAADPGRGLLGVGRVGVRRGRLGGGLGPEPAPAAFGLAGPLLGGKDLAGEDPVRLLAGRRRDRDRAAHRPALPAAVRQLLGEPRVL